MTPELVPVEHDPFQGDASSPGVAGTAWDAVKSFGREATKSTIGLIGAAGNQLSGANVTPSDEALRQMGEGAGPLAPTEQQLREALERVTGPLEEAKTAIGRYAGSVGGMVPTSILGGGSLLAKGAGAVASGVLGQAGEDVAGAPGRFVGSILGGGIAGAGTATRVPRPSFEDAFNTFQRLGLTPTAATTGVGGKTAQWLEANALPQAIGSANRMQKVVEGNLTQLTKKQQEIASKFGAPKTKAETGEDLQRTVLEGWQGRKEEAGKVFNAIGRAFGPNDTFFPSNLMRTVTSPIGAASTKEVRALTNAPEIQELDQLLTKTSGHLSYSDMIALKSKFGDMLDPAYAKPVNKAQISQIVESLDKDIEATIKTLGNKDVVRDWQYAKATYANAMQDYKQAFKKLLGTRENPVNAERVYDILVRQAGIKAGADMESFKRVWGELGKAKQGDLAATVLSHMGNKNPDKLSDLEGFSLSTFLTNYKNLSPDAKQLLFHQTGNATLDQSLTDLVTAAEKMGVWPALASSSRSGTVGGMMAQVAAPAVFAATGKFAEAAKALLLNIGGPAAASTILTDPKWVRRLAYAMDKVNAGMEGSAKALLGVASQMQLEDIQTIPGGSDQPDFGAVPPQENSGGGIGIPRLAEGGIVTQPTVAMIGEQGPEAVVPLDDPAAAQQAADVAAMRQRQTVIRQQSPSTQSFAPTESVLPQEPSNLLADISPQDQAMQAREIAAQRSKRSVRPVVPGGLSELITGPAARSQWPPSPELQAGVESVLDVGVPGYAAAKSAGRGDYGEAALEAGMSLAPFGAGKAAGALATPIGKAVAASTAALAATFTDSATGKSTLSPEAQDKLRFLQEKSKFEQKQRTEEAARKKQEADEKAARDAQAAQQAAQTQADLQARLAEIEATKQREKFKAEEDHRIAEQKAAEESIRANEAENKRLAERPFRLKHPDVALGMFMGGIAAASILPGATQGYKQWAYNTYLKDWAKLDAVAAKALQTGTREEQQLAVNRLASAAAQLAEREGKLEKYPWLVQLGAPAIAVEMSMLPAEIDIAQPRATEAHKSAVEYYTDPATLGSLAAVGGGGFGLGHYSREAAGMLPKRKIPTGTEGTIKTFEERNTAEALAREAEAKKKAESAAKRKATLEAKKKVEAKKEPEEPRKAKVPKGGPKIYGLREE